MDNFYFKCHQCGKSCNSGPELEISEIVKHSSNFPLAIRIRSSFGYESFSKEQIFSSKEQFLYQDGYYVSLSVFGYNYISLKKCPQLSNKGFIMNIKKVCQTLENLMKSISKNLLIWYTGGRQI